jgi:adapter protein MecA 1/2
MVFAPLDFWFFKLSGVKFMRLERVSVNKFKIFLTFDDLLDIGLTTEDLWTNFPKAHLLFQDMLFEASEELGMAIDGNITVQIHLLQAQGMLIVVTQEAEKLNDDYIEMKVTFDETKEFIYSFEQFEDIIQVCQHLSRMGIKKGAIYYWDGQYYMELNGQELLSKNIGNIIAIMSEFSSPSTVTSLRLKEYGKIILQEMAVERIKHYFLDKKSFP